MAFEPTPSGQYKMEQNGCGDIAGVVSLTGRSVAGQWEHLVCEGVLNVELDKTCKVGSAPGRPTQARLFVQTNLTAPSSALIRRKIVKPKLRCLVAGVGEPT